MLLFHRSRYSSFPEGFGRLLRSAHDLLDEEHTFSDVHIPIAPDVVVFVRETSMNFAVADHQVLFFF